MPSSEPRSNLYRMAQDAVGGDLRAYLAVQRAEGATFEQIARDLTTPQLIISSAVVRNWCVQLELHRVESRVAS